MKNIQYLSMKEIIEQAQHDLIIIIKGNKITKIVTSFPIKTIFIEFLECGENQNGN